MKRITDVIQALLDAGLSQTEIARRSGVPQCRISRWMRGNAAKAADDALTLLDLATTASAAHDGEASHD